MIPIKVPRAFRPRNFCPSIFQKQKSNVLDRDIMPFVEETLDKENPHAWYSTLMDYGASLKKREKDITGRSAHYVRQSILKGSDRQIRGEIVKAFSQKHSWTLRTLLKKVNAKPSQIGQQLDRLTKKRLLIKRGSFYRLAD